jgi:fructose-1,6-bisphosphatase/sedoheptulose 1,7-bisphosphatase-like protein
MDEIEIDSNEIAMLRKLDSEMKKRRINHQKKSAKDLNDSFKEQLKDFEDKLKEMGIEIDTQEFTHDNLLNNKEMPNRDA